MRLLQQVCCPVLVQLTGLVTVTPRQCLPVHDHQCLLLTSRLTLTPVLCVQYEDLDALLGPLPSLALHSSDDEVALYDIPEPEQVSNSACASTHSRGSGSCCLICSLYFVFWCQSLVSELDIYLHVHHHLCHALDQLPDTDACSVPAV